MTRKKKTARDRVLKKRPCAGVELSAMWGWQIMDYNSQVNPTRLSRSGRSESDAWVGAERNLRRWS